MRAAVLGHPIAHSLSPVLHRAAYEAAGLDWTYDAIDVDEPDLAGFLAGCGDEWGGLSLTMPLKVEAARLADFIEPQARLVGAINTLVPSGHGAYRQWVGANTDIHGIVAAIAEAGCSTAATGVVLGGGATATSAIAALGRLGVTRPVVAVRSRGRAGALLRAASKMGLSVRLVDLADEALPEAMIAADAVISTVPHAASEVFADAVAVTRGHIPGVLLDVVYSPPVSVLAAAWTEGGGRAVNGTRMLLHQAAEQFRLMTSREAPVAAMDSALGDVLHRS